MKYFSWFPSPIAFIALCFLWTTAGAAAHPSIDITASNWKFTPAAIEAHVGEVTTLHFTSSEGVHGVASGELGIKQTIIVPGKISAVTFTPKKAGTYEIKCAVICGPGHDTMILSMKVSE